LICVERKRALHRARSTASCDPVICDTILISQFLKFCFLDHLAILRYRSRERFASPRVMSINVDFYSIYRHVDLDICISFRHIVLRLRRRSICDNFFFERNTRTEAPNSAEGSGALAHRFARISSRLSEQPARDSFYTRL